jgi:endopolyphosphatase
VRRCGLVERRVSRSFVGTFLSYNVTGIDLDDDDLVAEDRRKKKNNGKKKKGGGHRHGKKPKTDCDKPEHEDQPHCKFRSKPRYFSPESPSRMNQKFTPLGYAQFYVPDLDKQTEEPPKWELEYATYDVEGLLRGGYNGTDGEDTGRQPVPWHLLPGFGEVDIVALNKEKDGGGRRDKDDGGMKKFRKTLQKYTPFKMSDLTIPNYIALAKELADDTPLWNKFARFM